MRIFAASFLCILFAAVAGCSVHPLPDDLGRETTFEIIHNVRCEARESVKDHLHALLLRSRSTVVRAIDPEDALENFELIRAQDPAIAATMEKYRLSAIAYLFSFDITENNNATDGDLFFALPWANSKFTLDVRGNVTKQRVGGRKIGVVETFEELDALQCFSGWEPRENRIYPILGSIGVTETVDSFFSLAESVGTNKKFSDVLTYTTTIDATADPLLEKKEVPHTFRLTKASVKLLAKREDVHMVVVALTFPVTTKTPSKTREFVATRSLLERAAEDDLGEVVDETKKKAAEEVCIQQALIQEQITGVVRLTSPEQYCEDDLRRY